MARKKTSAAEDMVQMVAKLPWWGGVALALAGWVVFHRLAATAPAPVAMQPGQMAGFLQRSILASLAYALQYIFPMLCLVAACVSWFGRRKRQALVQSVTRSGSADALNGMSWLEFEMLVAQAFRLQGFAVAEQGGAQADGGVDLVARKGSETWLVQCKQWRAFKVGVDVVRELYGVMAARGAAGGYVVTSGQFTDDARTFAEGRNVRLIDGTKLFGLLQQARTSLADQRSKPSPGGNAAPVQVATAPKTPSCPVCSAAMVRRTASKGANAGSQFWGCSTFPKCRGTR